MISSYSRQVFTTSFITEAKLIEAIDAKCDNIEKVASTYINTDVKMKTHEQGFGTHTHV